jgi:tRNA threonylcarbamoyl adenosine modification protein YjeE
MQGSTVFHLDTFIIHDEKSLENIVFPLTSGDRIFLTGDLGAGKSTFTRALLRHHFSDPHLIVRSPTYTYYQKYDSDLSPIPYPLSPIYHFDLYRLESFEDLYLIGARDILDDPTSICLIEWPEILGESERWTKKISITRMEDESRKVEIISQI